MSYDITIFEIIAVIIIPVIIYEILRQTQKMMKKSTERFTEPDEYERKYGILCAGTQSLPDEELDKQCSKLQGKKYLDCRFPREEFMKSINAYKLCFAKYGKYRPSEPGKREERAKLWLEDCSCNGYIPRKMEKRYGILDFSQETDAQKPVELIEMEGMFNEI